MKAAAWRVGALLLLGLALVVLAVAVVGGRWLAASTPALLRFEHSVYGLQVGAPVVMRGVRVGQVRSLSLAPAGPQGPEVPVRAELDDAMLADLLGEPGRSGTEALERLLTQGLVARLATQSLLTGQLYVELDVDPARAGPRTPGAALDIPTEPTRLQSLQEQLRGVDLGQLARDLAAVSASARSLLGAPGAADALARASSAARALEQMAQEARRELPVLSQDARRTLAEARQALREVAAAASQAQVLAAGGQPALDELRRSLQAMGRAADQLAAVGAEDGPLREGSERTLREVAQAARALRAMAEQIERQPESLLRGRRD